MNEKDNSVTAGLQHTVTYGENTFWWAARTLYKRRIFITVITVLGIVTSVVLALLLPISYKAETRVMLPEEGSSSVLGMLESVAPGASAVLGQSSGGYTRYLSILTSRTVMENVVERFELERVYETTESPTSLQDAVATLRSNFDFNVALDFDYLALSVLDADPERAARIANYLVEVLNRENMRLTAANARQNREFIEHRLAEAQTELDSAQVELQLFQERHGVVDIEEQSAAFFQSLASLRANIASLEIQYGSLRRQLGDDNAQTIAAHDALQEARATLRRLSSGSDTLMPIPLRDLPEASRAYASIYQSVVEQTKILETIRPLYEQARFTEERDAIAVQVLDPAIPPARKAKPQRKIIVIAIALSFFLLSTMYVLFLAWWRENKETIAHRLSSN